jgi:glycosyltransferase involved in cell wall biosynthesis
MERSELAIIIPAYNEDQTIGSVVESVREYGEVIVVNDCSSDKTAERAAASGATVISHITNKGYDEALNSGFNKALELKTKYAITFDADGQHEHSLIKNYIERLEAGNDLVLGVRPEKARISESIMGIYFSLRFGIDDILCGMKGYNLRWVEMNNGFDHINSIGSELAFFIVNNKAPFCQISVPIHERQDQSRFGTLIRSNLKIFRALFKVINLDIKKGT